MASRTKKEKGATPLLEQIREAIRGSGLSLNRLEQLSGVGNDRLSRFMRSERDLTGAAIEKLCKALRLNLVQEEPS